ncbi:hypothetical protein MAUB1S_04549 [Mycolicibacterium aubagnense]
MGIPVNFSDPIYDHDRFAVGVSASMALPDVRG